MSSITTLSWQEQLDAVGLWRLPASATYVIDARGTIAAAGVRAAPTQRMDPEAVLDALRAL